MEEKVMSNDYDRAVRLCNAGWVIVSISSTDKKTCYIEIENEGDVNQDREFPDGKASLEVTNEEAKKLSKAYGVEIVKG